MQLAGHGFVNEGAALAIGQLDFAGIFSDWTLYPNYPNPFSDLTNLRYGMPEASRVVVDIYDVIGRRVAILVDEELPAGSHTVVWNGVDQTGRPVPSGMYFARLKAGSHVKVHRMMVVR